MKGFALGLALKQRWKATRKSRIQKSLRFFVTIYEHYCSDRRSIRTSQTSIQSGQLLFTMVSTLYRWTDIQPLSERALKHTMLRWRMACNRLLGSWDMWWPYVAVILSSCKSLIFKFGKKLLAYSVYNFNPELVSLPQQMANQNWSWCVRSEKDLCFWCYFSQLTNFYLILTAAKTNKVSVTGTTNRFSSSFPSGQNER